MALYEPAFNFMMDDEDSTRAGKVTPDPSEAHPDAVARFGINSGANPEAVAAGFYTMTTEDALVWAASFFRVKYWEPILGPQINDQTIANKYFTLSVNEYYVESTKILQRAVNFLNPTLIVDGGMGPKTLTAINAVDPVQLLASFKSYARQFYQDWAARTHQTSATLASMIARVNR